MRKPFLVLVLAVAACLCHPAAASDHADTDGAGIGDFYVFTRGKNLVLAMTIAMDIPDPNKFSLPGDLAYRFLIDRHSKVSGGKIVNPGGIKEDVVFDVRLPDGKTQLAITGLRTAADGNVRLFTGVRDDPFIRAVVMGKNVGAIVVEVPLESVFPGKDRPTILAWCTLGSFEGPVEDLGANPYRSQDLRKLNTTHPSHHKSDLGVEPDVLIFDANAPSRYPNGRDLPDDIVAILKRPVPGPHPTQNDVPFLTEFPYLAPPHPGPTKR